MTTIAEKETKIRVQTPGFHPDGGYLPALAFPDSFSHSTTPARATHAPRTLWLARTRRGCSASTELAFLGTGSASARG